MHNLHCACIFVYIRTFAIMISRELTFIYQFFIPECNDLAYCYVKTNILVKNNLKKMKREKTKATTNKKKRENTVHKILKSIY